MKLPKNYDAQQLIETTNNLFSHFKFNPDEDLDFFQGLIDEFDTEINIMHQLKQFHAWCVDQHPTKIKNFRFRFRGWLANSLKYQQSKTVNGTPFPITS